MTTSQAEPQRDLFDALSIAQARTLMRRISKAISDTSQVCTILYRAAGSRYPNLDERYHNTHRDLCELHSHLFDSLMVKYQQAEDAVITPPSYAVTP